MTIIETIKKREGLRLKPYRCPAGKLTIGYGRNLEDRGITAEEADFLFEHDIMEAHADLRLLFDPVAPTMTQTRWEALLDMRFNMGAGGFRTFERMIAAVQAGEWEKAAAECLDSDYASTEIPGQVPWRAMENAEALRVG